MQHLHGFLSQKGRDLASCGLDMQINMGSGAPTNWQAAATRWQSLGATHIALTALPADRTPRQVLAAITEARRIIAAELGTVQ